MVLHESIGVCQFTLSETSHSRSSPNNDSSTHLKGDATRVGNRSLRRLASPANGSAASSPRTIGVTVRIAANSGDEEMMPPMQDATSLATALQPLLPLRIGAVELNYPSLVVVGERWSVALLAEWTWRRDSVVVTDWDTPRAEDVVWELCGLELLGVSFPDPAYDGDCSFTLSDGALDVRSDRSGYESWTFRHDDLDIVFVGL